MGEGLPEDVQGIRVPRVLLIALACVVVTMVALPLAAQPFLPNVTTALVVRNQVGVGNQRVEVVAPRRDGESASAYRTPIQINLVALAAERQVGARYVESGDTPVSGFSCVGLVHWAYAQAGIAVPESVPGLEAAFPAVAGATPQGNGLEPGDVLLYHDTAWAGLSHASIYIGDGLMVSADSPETGVRLERTDDAYWVAHWWGAVRVPGGQRAVRIGLVG